MTQEGVNSADRVLLALDAAGASCSVALWAGGAVKVRRFSAMARGQSERLVPMIGEVMAEWGGGFEALDALAVTTGPGGFTGCASAWPRRAVWRWPAACR